MLMIRQVTVNHIPKTIINGLGLSIVENTGVIAVAKNTTAILLINSANCLSCLLLNFGIFQLAVREGFEPSIAFRLCTLSKRVD